MMLFMAGVWGSAMCTSIKKTCECVSTLAGGKRGEALLGKLVYPTSTQEAL